MFEKTELATRSATAFLAVWLNAVPALAEQTLYCTDTAITGFKWENAEEGHLAEFKLARFTVKIETESERQIIQTTDGDLVGLHQYYACKKVGESKVSCDTGRSTTPWVFIGENYYVRAFLAGGPPSTYLRLRTARAPSSRKPALHTGTQAWYQVCWQD